MPKSGELHLPLFAWKRYMDLFFPTIAPCTVTFHNVLHKHTLIFISKERCLSIKSRNLQKWRCVLYFNSSGLPSLSVPSPYSTQQKSCYRNVPIFKWSSAGNRLNGGAMEEGNNPWITISEFVLSMLIEPTNSRSECLILLVWQMRGEGTIWGSPCRLTWTLHFEADDVFANDNGPFWHRLRPCFWTRFPVSHF